MTANLKEGGIIPAFWSAYFGKISEEKEKKRFLSDVDNWLNSLRTKEALSIDETWGMNLTNLKMTCQKEHVQEVFMMSTVAMGEEENKLQEKLVNALSEFGITAIRGGNIISDAKAFEAMVKCGQVVLIEKTNVSNYSTIEKNLHCVMSRE